MSTAAQIEEPRACRTCGSVKPADDFYQHQGGRRVHCKTCMRQRDKARYRDTNGKDAVFDKSLRRLYGITLEQYQSMVEEQGQRCGLCGEQPDTAKRMHVDHDHATGQIRALLCHHCNLLLGNAKDSIVRLRQAIAYLERHQHQRQLGENR
ncbi:endonuclease domain-containing protein [Streptomyces sp. MP131-18]|uniref:endonuclease domain-containing protein n=1 Tax=Streptomyces sp. MP131-18 TaxID=1857892 RepID=UPI0009A1C932|nr:endonuclease domain-containing protein [Streptomyces sp. MP131-18]ONK09556.1 recombination endonuclease VII [Streptomyces sp. MP131-18]